MRYFLNRSVVESFEISGFALAACIGLGMGYTVTAKAHIRVDSLVARLPFAMRATCDVLALALVAAALAWFAATSGSSIATAATIGTVAIPQMDKGGYNRPLFLGSIAAGWTLGILIPPSINMIIYAVLTDTSVADPYAAGFIPGLC